MNLQILENLGLTNSEVKVYLALLELGYDTAGNIATKSKTTSSKIYEVLDKLIEKGLASSIIENGIKHYNSSDPEILFDYIKKKEKELKYQKKELKILVPLLKKRAQLGQLSSESKIYKGFKGLKSAFSEGIANMKKGDELIAMNVPSRSDQVNIYFTKLSKELDKKGIRVRSIYSIEAKGEIQTQITSGIQAKFRDNLTPAAINILGNRVIIFPKEDLNITLFVIDNPAVAESFRVQFETLWNLD